MPSDSCPIPVNPSGINIPLIIGCTFAVFFFLVCVVCVWRKMKHRGHNNAKEEGLVGGRVESPLEGGEMVVEENILIVNELPAAQAGLPNTGDSDSEDPNMQPRRDKESNLETTIVPIVSDVVRMPPDIPEASLMPQHDVSSPSPH